ncbi:MAG: hypothetical protein IJE72_04020 [Clostridia bacterium]|nr:hypothetical protein [Clostridia bacterium]
MKIDLTDAAFYSTWNSEKELKYEFNNWLEKSSYQFFYTEKLIDEFGYKDYAEIEASGHFIPVFKTDIVALKKEYVLRFLSKEAADEILMIMEYNRNKHSNFTGYDVAFNIFCEEHEDIFDDYWNYERSHLLKDAEKWCKGNGVPYYAPYDTELKFDLNNSYVWALYYKDSKLSCSDYWLDKKDFHVVPSSHIQSVYGYLNDCDILDSGRFVKLFKKEAIEMEKEYVAIHLGQDAKKSIEMFLEENNDCSYEDAFFNSISNNIHKKSWEEYKNSQLVQEAKQWCIENNIPYYISKNRPDHLGSKILPTDQSGAGSMIDKYLL